MLENALEIAVLSVVERVYALCALLLARQTKALPRQRPESSLTGNFHFVSHSALMPS